MYDVGGIEAAFVFGSWARGDTCPDSDVDLFMVGDDVASDTLGDALLRAQALLGRSVDVKRYTRKTLAAAVARRSRFLDGVLAGPKEWLIGSAESLSSATRGTPRTIPRAVSST